MYKLFSKTYEVQYNYDPHRDFWSVKSRHNDIKEAQKEMRVWVGGKLDNKKYYRIVEVTKKEVLNQNEFPSQ